MLGNQLLRAATGIGANVEEGQGAQSRADFIAKYSIALKEARETRYWLRLLVASELVSRVEVEELLKEVSEIATILAKSIITARKNRNQSPTA